MHIHSFVKLYQCDLKILSRNENLTSIKGHNSVTNLRKTTSNNSDLDLVNINEYTKFIQILSISSQAIDRKRNYVRNSDISQGPQSKKGGKDQGSIQSSTTHDPGYHMGK